jgi:hypothetical protein
MELVKKCKRCGETKPRNLFAKSSKSKTGCQSHCKSCRSAAALLNSEVNKAKSKAWYEANKERVLEEQRLDRANNPGKYKEKEAAKYVKHRERILAYASAYQKAKPESNREASKRYRQRTPGKQCAKSAKYRARKLQATPEWANSEFEQFFLQEIYHLSQLRSASGAEHHVDHIVPFVSKFVCGLHCAANLRVIPGAENCSKGNKYWPDMW